MSDWTLYPAGTTPEGEKKPIRVPIHERFYFFEDMSRMLYARVFTVRAPAWPADANAMWVELVTQTRGYAASLEEAQAAADAAALEAGSQGKGLMK